MSHQMPRMHKVSCDQLANSIRSQLSSNRVGFVVSKYMFEPYTAVGPAAGKDGLRFAEVGDPDHIEAAHKLGIPEQKVISSAAMKILLDYCEHEEWNMDFVEYCAGMFHGRMPQAGETAFDLLPDVRTRLNADRLGLGHIYGGET